MGTRLFTLPNTDMCGLFVLSGRKHQRFSPAKSKSHWESGTDFNYEGPRALGKQGDEQCWSAHICLIFNYYLAK